MERDFLAENSVLQKCSQLLLSYNLSAMSFSDAGMADCKVRRTGEDGLKG